MHHVSTSFATFVLILALISIELVEADPSLINFGPRVQKTAQIQKNLNCCFHLK